MVINIIHDIKAKNTIRVLWILNWTLEVEFHWNRKSYASRFGITYYLKTIECTITEFNTNLFIYETSNIRELIIVLMKHVLIKAFP